MEKNIFNGRVKIVVGGRAEGDHALKSHITLNRRSGGNVGRVLTLIDRLGVDCVIPESLFTHHIIDPKAQSARFHSIGSRVDNPHLLLRPVGPADGCLLTVGGLGAGVCNADCPVGVMVSSKSERGCLLHLGLQCLLPLEGSWSIIHQAVKVMQEPAADLSLWVGFGIGPCCYGHDPASRLGQKVLSEIEATYSGVITQKRVVSGRRVGQVAIDLVQIVKMISGDLGLGNLEIDRSCTACAFGDSDARTFFSHTQGDSPHRNGVVARLIK